MKADEYFEYWLRDRESLDEVVGVAQDHKECPLARWMSEALGACNVFVTRSRIRWGDYGEDPFGPSGIHDEVDVNVGFLLLEREIDTLGGEHEVSAREALVSLDKARIQADRRASIHGIGGDSFYSAV